MKYIFYFFGIFAIMYELHNMYSAKTMFNWIKYTKETLKKKDKPSKNQTFFVLMQILYMGWCFVGLLTFEWVLFGALIILGFLTTKKNIVLFWIDSLLSAILVTFIVLNAFHFHIDVSGYFLNIFKK